VNRLADLAWPDLEPVGSDGVGDAAAGRVLLVPLGSLEQHGPHLPFDTDTAIITAVVAAAARRLPHALVAPVIPFGASGEHQGFAGTLSIGAEATEHLLVELGRSAAETFPALCFVNGHGGNVAALDRAVARLQAEGRAVRGWSPRWEGDAHAGAVETSLMLVVAPERVRLSAAVAGDTRPLSEVLPLLRRDGVRSVSASGVLGDPTGARPDEGRRLLQEAVDGLVAFVRREFPPPRPADRPGAAR
jgi:creatinine amidohydrolase